ncbi:hypothetical protein Sme01_18320 [Sphaerisporangium melleum]|uniref:Abi-like protein n=1 Tax=Sphaerisporangium melleum TaxID=321316 RepID=A0A917VU68_9ACTN|nr:hypothetical protein [Sphaerisporangium melleum]GGL14547.1 hypothetical protein GCM10007964_65680 [Sphaerisporangium melleum]GII69356.1 hypothetical protein Sme01_18320 [Sphaerisporangium melleum]
MNPQLPAWMRRTLSAPRLAPYLLASGADAERAERLYYWNVEAAAAFYGPLHFLEVCLRNVLHDTLKGHFARSDWWQATALGDHNDRKIREAVARARENAGQYAGRIPGPDDVVAELSFGFWVSLLSRRYDRTLWVPVVHGVFRNCRETRRALHDGLLSLVLLRNRIMHHEPIHHRDLAADYAKICRMLGYLEPGVARRLPHLDRVAEVLGRKNGVCSGSMAPRF